MIQKPSFVNSENSYFTKSSASCKLSKIKGFIFGPFSSRFWIIRKQINSIPCLQYIHGKVPFFAWDCITIETETRFIDLVIKNEQEMMYLIVYLTHNIPNKGKKNDPNGQY